MHSSLPDGSAIQEDVQVFVGSQVSHFPAQHAALRLDLPDLTGPVAEFLVRRDLAAIARHVGIVGQPGPVHLDRFHRPGAVAG
jgi:hypothetical protein